MISLSLKKISKIINGKLYGINLIINKIVIDSHKSTPGSLFIALIGKKFDAHRFIKDAIKQGCSAVITQKKIPDNISYIMVKNTSIALGQIAAWIRNYLNTTVISITGSSGKTSVKEMTASILQNNGETISTINNLNNNIGVPITLLRLKKLHKYAVIELGANHPGEISYTTNISQPDIVLINNIYPAHLEGFKSLLGVSKAKEEIFSGLKKNGIVIINLDSHHLSQWEKKIHNKKIFYFSIKKKKGSNFFTSNVNIHVNHTSFIMHTPSRRIHVYLPFLGYQNISNALAASAIAFALNISLQNIQKGLRSTITPSGRLKSINISTNQMLIDDTYNANIASVITAIKVLEKMPGYKILVIGDMAELGDKSIVYHQIIGNIANMSKIDKILSIGKFSYIISKNFHNGKHFYQKITLQKYLKKMINHKNPMTILIKGSRNMQMETIVKYIITGHQTNDLVDK